MSENIYESKKLVDEYLLFHYAKPEDQMQWAEGPAAATNFPVRVASHFSQQKVKRALDLGCAVGRSSYELAAHADEVVSIDFSAAFIDAAKQLQASGVKTISRLVEANLFDEIEVERPSKAENIHFQVGDAMNLEESLGTFDRVLAANLLCRLPDPRVLLGRLPSLLNQGGELVLATPCTWLEEFTPSEHWPTGSTLDWLKESLSDEFDFIEEKNEPFLIRETSRKFQWSVSMLTRWIKK